MWHSAPPPSPLVEQATQDLRDRITGGHWPVGTGRPAETARAKTLGVGRSTVREALRAPAGAGLVQVRQGSGVFVIAVEPEASPTRDRRKGPRAGAGAGPRARCGRGACQSAGVRATSALPEREGRPAGGVSL